MKQEASSDKYDVVIIGAGIGGLTCGAYLALAGKKVLLVEAEEHVGGFAREFQHGSYSINPALHVIMGCGLSTQPGHGLIDITLSQLGVRDYCEFVRVDPFYRAKFPDLQMDVPLGREPFLEVHQKAFPDEAEKIKELFNLCSKIHQEYIRFPIVPRIRDWILMPVRFPTLFRYANATLESVMNNYLSNPRLKSALGVLWPYVGLPPSRVSFAVWATMLISYIEEGAFYCLRGFQRLADALAIGMSNHGGEIILNNRVIQIHSQNLSIQSVTLGSGQVIYSPVVISNIDPRLTFSELLKSSEVAGRYIRKLKQLKPSMSLMGLHLATDLDIHNLGVPKVTMIFPRDLESVYTNALAGRVGGLGMHIPSVYDASLAPQGEYILVLQAFIPSDANKLSNSASDQFANQLLDLAESELPNLRNHITFIDGFTDQSPQHYPLHRIGPMYGWAAMPSQTGPRRLAIKTPVKGLFLTGHWTQPGHGIWTVVLSGINTARIVLGQDTSQSLWPFNI